MCSNVDKAETVVETLAHSCVNDKIIGDYIVLLNDFYMSSSHHSSALFTFLYVLERAEFFIFLAYVHVALSYMLHSADSKFIIEG